MTRHGRIAFVHVMVVVVYVHGELTFVESNRMPGGRNTWTVLVRPASGWIGREPRHFHAVVTPRRVSMECQEPFKRRVR